MCVALSPKSKGNKKKKNPSAIVVSSFVKEYKLKETEKELMGKNAIYSPFDCVVVFKLWTRS